MIIAADAGSVYEPYPSVSLEWDPERPRSTPKGEGHSRSMSGIGLKATVLSNGLPPVLETVFPTNAEPFEDVSPSQSSRAQKAVITGHEIWCYDDNTT